MRMTGLKATISKLDRQWAAAINRKDAAATAAMYTADAVMLPTGDKAVVKGRNAIRAVWKEIVKSYGQAKFTTVSLTPLASNLVCEIGKFRVMAMKRRKALTGQYVVVWRKSRGKWLVEVDASFWGK